MQKDPLPTFRRATKAKTEAGPPLLRRMKYKTEGQRGEQNQRKSKKKETGSSKVATALATMFVLDWLWFVSI